MPDYVQSYSTSKFTNDQLGEVVDSMVVRAKDSRKSFSRRWYDNKFFDDGHHFRYLRRTDNKIIDLSDRASLWSPMRAIPKASRQVRGVTNLLVSQGFVPVVYPEKVYKAAFPPTQGVDPNTGQPVMQPNPEYQQALEESKRIAETTGHWIEEEFKKHEMKEQKIPHLVNLAAINSISYVKIWPDPVEETIRSTVRDAFDVYVMGSLNELTDLPFMGEGVPRLIAEIKADERFDKEAVERISPENKHASDEIKDAYMRARFGGEFNQAEQTSTLIQKEFYLKEYLNEDNAARIRLQKDGDKILKRHTNSEGKLKYGDPVFRQVFVAGNIPLRASYVNLPDFPYADFRMEPGPLYQVPLIERFIPANKSLDMLVSRLERYSHTMVTGSWSIKAGEPAEPNNSAGGQVFKYNTTPPVQNQIANVPPFYFNFINLLNSFIEEQGVPTSSLAQLPSGVKAAKAIESLKESEYATLVVATNQLKKTIKRISEKMLDIADDYFVQPQTVYFLEKGEPQYFDVIGATALERRQDQGLTNGLSGEEVPLKRDYYVEIEVQQGLGYTKEGKKAAAKELGDFMVQLAQLGIVNPQTVQVFIQHLLETYEFGPTKDIMEAMKEGGDQQMGEQQIAQVKVAVMEVFKDLIEQGILPDQQTRIDEGKMAVAEAARDTGLLDKEPKQDPKTVMELAKGKQQMEQSEDKHKLEMEGEKQKLTMEQVKAIHGMRMAEKMAKQGGQNATDKGQKSKNNK